MFCHNLITILIRTVRVSIWENVNHSGLREDWACHYVIYVVARQQNITIRWHSTCKACLDGKTKTKCSWGLRWLTTVFPRLRSACCNCLPDVSISCRCKNDTSNPKKTWKQLQQLKGVKSLLASVVSNCFQTCVFKPRANKIWKNGP